MLTLPSAVERLLERRRLVSDLSAFPPPSAWGFEEAGGIIADYLIRGKRICVWGDYDVDGTTSTAIFMRFCNTVNALNGFSAIPLWHVPDRFSEGYGVNEKRIPYIAAHADLLVTVDCGITSFEALSKAKELRLPVIVTDHHLPSDTLPPALAIADPAVFSYEDSDFMQLCGAGVIFSVLCAAAAVLRDKGYRIPRMSDFLDFVALAEVADVADLGGAGRPITKYGLSLLSRAERECFAALKRAMGFAREKTVTSEDIGFFLAPPVNAAGRMANAREALSLFLEDDPKEAFKYAVRLAALNSRRKDAENRVVFEARGEIEDAGHGLALAASSWHPGVVGIAASRIVEEYRVPVLLCVHDGKTCKGSGRSDGITDLHAALALCPSLTRFGGHRMAAGVEFPLEKLESVREEFSEACVSTRIPEKTAEKRYLEVAAHTITISDMSALNILEPFGEGNPEPLFVSENLRLFGMKETEKRLTLELWHPESDTILKGVFWRPGKSPETTDVGRKMKILYTPKISSFGGDAQVELALTDWKFV